MKVLVIDDWKEGGWTIERALAFKRVQVARHHFFHPKISSILERNLTAIAWSFSTVIDCSKFSKR